jgi:hypothetical protein
MAVPFIWTAAHIKRAALRRATLSAIATEDYAETGTPSETMSRADGSSERLLYADTAARTCAA